MKTKFTQSYLSRISVTGKAFWLTDEGFQNLRLYVGASGTKTWYVGFRENGSRYKNHKLGSADVLTVTEARDKARDFLNRLAKGEEPYKKIEKKLQLGEFIETHYGPWVEVNRKTGKETMAILRSSFQFLFKQPIDELKTLELEKWRMKRLNEGSKSATINRLMTSLKAVLNWAVSMEIIKENPISKFKPMPERDSRKIIRYLSADERTRLMAALDEREKEMRRERQNHNEWLKERHFEELPSYEHFTDHLKPMVVLSLSTGIRKGTLFGLEWRDVNFTEKIITLRDEIEKSDKTRYMPMNDTTYDVLVKWKKQSLNTAPNTLVFLSPKTGKKIDHCNSSWKALLKRAKVENFRWHDMRHDFASQLVMAGVDLNTVRDLMGHADTKMTLRYAHLAPENRLQAVKVLDRNILLTPMPETAG